MTPTTKTTDALIRAWLGLTAEAWPPDHYTLLGLPRGEADVRQIEQRAQAQMSRVRSYQLSHPAAATEAMNLLAQAFNCLLNKKAKLAYDASLGIRPIVAAETTHTAQIRRSSKATPMPLPASAVDTAVSNPVTQVDWQPPAPLPAPAPVIAEPMPTAVLPPVEMPPVAAVEVAEPPPTPTLTAAAPIAVPMNPLIALARKSAAARRGLSTLHGLDERLQQTKELLRAWQKAGKYLHQPTSQLTGPTADAEVTTLLVAVFESLEGFPHIIGQPGQPGYRVVALAEQDTLADMFNRLDTDQRELLARDWADGRDVLVEHLKFVREQIQALQRQGPLQRLLRPVRWLLRDHSGWVWLGLGVTTAAVIAVLLLR